MRLISLTGIFVLLTLVMSLYASPVAQTETVEDTSMLAQSGIDTTTLNNKMNVGDRYVPRRPNPFRRFQK
jgi:hypothetical protein